MFSRASDSGTSSMTEAGISISRSSTNGRPCCSALAFMMSSALGVAQLDEAVLDSRAVQPLRFLELIGADHAAADQDFGPIPSLRHGCTLPNSRPPREGTGKTGSRTHRAVPDRRNSVPLCLMQSERVCGLTSITRGVRSCD